MPVELQNLPLPSLDYSKDMTPAEMVALLQRIEAKCLDTFLRSFDWTPEAVAALGYLAVLLQAAERTSAGQIWNAENDIRLYSLVNIYVVAGTPSEIEDVLRIVARCFIDEAGEYGEYRKLALAGLDPDGVVIEAMNYMVEDLQAGCRSTSGFYFCFHGGLVTAVQSAWLVGPHQVEALLCRAQTPST